MSADYPTGFLIAQSFYMIIGKMITKSTVRTKDIIPKTQVILLRLVISTGTLRAKT